MFHEDLLEEAWGIIANAGGGDWTKESPEWQEAAARWREKYHKTLPSFQDEPAANRCSNAKA